MSKLLFGLAGIPHSAKQHDSIGGIERVAELGLSAMELEFVYGVKMKKEMAGETKKASENNKVSLSVHAPYYINLNAQERQKLGLSKHNVLESARIGTLAGAGIVLFHPGFYMKMQPMQVYEKIKSVLQEILDEMRKEKINTRLGLETTGKNTSFGTLEENIMLGEELKGVFPVIDFAHIHARGNGMLKGEKEVQEVIEKIPKRFLNGLHMHMSGIRYTEKGERNHLNLEEKGNSLPWKVILDLLKEKKVSGTIISESPNLEEDALLMQKHCYG